MFYAAVMAQGVSRSMKRRWLILRAEKGGNFKGQTGDY